MVLNLELTSFLSLFTQAVSSSQTALHLSPCHSQGQQNLIIPWLKVTLIQMLL